MTVVELCGGNRGMSYMEIPPWMYYPSEIIAYLDFCEAHLGPEGLAWRTECDTIESIASRQMSRIVFEYEVDATLFRLRFKLL